MAITDELRKWMENATTYGPFVGGDFPKKYAAPWFGWKSVIVEMLDRIDAEAEDNERFRREAGPFCDRLREAAAECADVTLFGVDYVALPGDADGVPWYRGSMVVVPEDPSRVHTVWIAGDNTLITDDQLFIYDANKLRHHHAPTVEDVLREFADEVQRCCDTVDTIAEYASKLRLAEEVDA